MVRCPCVHILIVLVALSGPAPYTFAATCDQPRVNLQAGQITISSDGCSLLQVLNRFGRETGVTTEVPGSASALPVYGVFGPGSPKDVVSALLDGIPFNWTVSTEDNSGKLIAVSLAQRTPPLPAVKVAAVGNGTTSAGISRSSVSGNVQPEVSAIRPKLDDSNTSKLPQLPPGVPSSMWNLYPSLALNGGTVPSGPPLLPNGQPLLTSASTTSSSNSGSSNSGSSNSGPLPPFFGPLGCANCPVPPGVDPAIRNIYPSNLLQLIGMPIMNPNIQLPPMARPLTNH